MMEPTQASGTPAEPTTQPQAGNPPTTTTTPANPPAGADPTSQAASEQMSLDEAKKLRQEHNALRKRLAEFEAAQKAADDAKLSETEKLAKRAETAEKLAAERLERVIASDIKLAAQGLAFHDPSDAIDRVLPQVRAIDDEGERDKAIAKALSELVKAKPYLVAATQSNGNGATQAQAAQRPTSSSGGATNPGGAGGIQGQGVIFTREQINRMSPAEYERNKAAIYDQMAKNLIR